MSASNQINDDSQNRCPLCGGLNRCAVLEDKSVEDCWCKVVEIPPDLLKDVPVELRGKACVCRACVMAYNSSSR